VDFDRYLERDREAELAKLRARRAERDARRRAYRRRRAIAVAIVALPVAVLAAAMAWPSGGAGTAASRTLTPPRPVVVVTTPVPRRVMPEEVRGVHVSIYRAGDAAFIGSLVAQADPTRGINAVELDVKDEHGLIGFVGGAPAAAVRIGAAKPYYDAVSVVRRLHHAGLWVIGRVVVFEDPVLATTQPSLAIRTRSGGVWTNTRGLAWTNPYDPRVWQYVIDTALAAGRVGFDEVEFDYVRFPTDGPVADAVFPHKRRGPLSATITAFLRTAVAALHHEGLIVSANLFGLAASGDLGIGQDPRALRDVLDVISPMAYPCSYGAGQYTIADPCADPSNTVNATMLDYERELYGGTAQVRPWLQAGTIGQGAYGPTEVHQQVRAVRSSSSHGFLLWNADVQYPPAMLAF
jgi:hypothetical protein